MSIWYVGDLHGFPEFFAEIDRKARLEGVSSIVQVGDFGIRWPGKTLALTDSGEKVIVDKKHPNCPIVQFFNKRADRGITSPVWYTCGGNHDNWRAWERQLTKVAEKDGRYCSSYNSVELSPGCYWIPRGKTIEIEDKKHLFFGGAESIDRHSRIEKIDWWSEEIPTSYQFDQFFDVLEEERPEVVITHDCPTFIINKFKSSRTSVVSQNLARVHELSNYKPKNWYFGHHHRLEEWFHNETHFKCCGLHGQYWASGGYRGQVLPARRMKLP